MRNCLRSSPPLSPTAKPLVIADRLTLMEFVFRVLTFNMKPQTLTIAALKYDVNINLTATKIWACASSLGTINILPSIFGFT